MSLTGLVFLLLVAAGLAMSFVRHPVWGLYTYILVFYLDAPSRWWGTGLPNLRWSLLTVAVTIASTLIYTTRNKQKSDRPSFLSHGPQALFFTYVVWMYVQIFWAISPDHPDGVTYFTKYLVIMYLIYLLVDNQERVFGFLTAHLIGCFYLGTVAYGASFGGRLDGVGGAGIDDSNNLGLYMATAAVAAGGMYLMRDGWLKLIPVIAMPLCLNTLVQAGSRGAFLALMCGLLAMYIYRPRGTTATVWGYGIVGIVLFLILAGGSFWERMGTIFDAAQQTEVADKSAMSRYAIAKAQWEMVLDHPFGTGHKGTGELSYTYIASEFWSSGGGRSSHNTLLSAMVDQGFFGLIIWCGIYWKLFQKCRSVARWAKIENDDKFGWLAAIILGIFTVAVVGGLFLPFIKGEVFVWIIALSCSLWSCSVGTGVTRLPGDHKSILMNAGQKWRSAP